MSDQRLTAAVGLRGLLGDYLASVQEMRVPGSDGVSWVRAEPLFGGDGEEVVADHGSMVTFVASMPNPTVAELMVTFEPEVVHVIASVLEGKKDLDDLANALCQRLLT